MNPVEKYLSVRATTFSYGKREHYRKKFFKQLAKENAEGYYCFDPLHIIKHRKWTWHERGTIDCEIFSKGKSIPRYGGRSEDYRFFCMELVEKRKAILKPFEMAAINYLNTQKQYSDEPITPEARRFFQSSLLTTKDKI